MTRIERIGADAFLVLSAMICARPRHPHSIDAFFSRYDSDPLAETNAAR